MAKSKSSISGSSSYEGIGEFWDKNSLADFQIKTKPAKMKLKIKSIQYSCNIEKNIFKQLVLKAETQGLPVNSLINLYLQEKL